MAEDVMLQEAVEAIRQGQRGRAKDLLTRLLRSDQNNPTYWLYMSSVVDTPREQVYCLQSALKADPQNAAARQGLVLLGALAPEANIVPVPPVRRKWDVPVEEIHEVTGIRRITTNPIFRIGCMATLALLVVALVGFGLIWQGIGRQVAAVIPTNTEGPTPTYTYTPTPINYTPVVPTAIPTNAGPQPLWMRLKATYTPTPIYIATPHAANEAFMIAQRAMNRGEWSTALSNLQQAQQMSPDAADITYLIGEIQRQQGDYEAAIEAYEKALQIDPNFAPAYLGRAQAMLAQNPTARVDADVDTAIEKDPNFIEAYLLRAERRLAQEDYENALKDLAKVEELRPGSAMYYLTLAKVQLAEGENDAALQSAKQANQLDQTILEGYKVLAQASAANDDYQTAMRAINIYLQYEQNDAMAYVIQGQGLFLQERYSDTLTALNQAIEMDKKLVDAYYVRGLTYLELDNGPKALNDLYYVYQMRAQNFDVSINYARSLMAAGYLGEAVDQVKRSEDKAKTDAQMAQVLYWRAQLLEKIGNLPSASRAWRELLALPEEAVPADWRALAEARLKATVTPPPPTPTATRTVKPSATLKPSVTPKPSATPKPSTTPIPSPTPNPSATP
jgi:tetratricopeptide (TPR) repeat protein